MLVTSAELAASTLTGSGATVEECEALLRLHGQPYSDLYRTAAECGYEGEYYAEDTEIPIAPPWWGFIRFRAGDYYDMLHRGDRQMFYELFELDSQDVASGRATPEQVDKAILAAFSRLSPDRYCVSRIYVTM